MAHHEGGKEHLTDAELVRCPIHEAFGEEVNMFTHIHLRGYDQNGDGKQMHAEYYDKYGAPMKYENSWLDGYRAVETELADYFNCCCNPKLPFPPVAASAGGCHLYDPLHHNKPWNWTGFVPAQMKWCCYNKFFQNRHFISLRGNEVQNNLWNYHPHDEEPGASGWDAKYQQLVPRDKYRGGYFFYNNSWGRYLHLISLKSVKPEPYYVQRYNYIVHPLAYRANVADYPDNSVDAMQWSIINVNDKELNKVPIGRSTGVKVSTRTAFGEDELDRWGDKCHGIEIFNDFTYYYSSTPLDDGDNWKGANGFLHDGRRPDFIHWFNSYPHEMGEFLVETALNHGSYLQILAANDAMYKRNDFEVQHCDPKAPATSNLKHDAMKQEKGSLKEQKRKGKPGNKEEEEQQEEANQFMLHMPYKEDTVFGYIALIDPEKKIKESIYGPPPHCKTDLNEGEKLIFDQMIAGHFFAHTGVYDLFNWRDDCGCIKQFCPIMIENQDPRNYYIDYNTELHDLIFTMPRAKAPVPNKPADKKSIEDDILWQMTVTTLKEKDGKSSLECHRMYFKLSEERRTRIDLTGKFNEDDVAWLRIQGYDVVNPQRRAWFQAIKGPKLEKLNRKSRKEVFGSDPVRLNKALTNPNLDNFVHNMTRSDTYVDPYDSEKFITYNVGEAVDLNRGVRTATDLKFMFPQDDEDKLFVYYMQCKSHPVNSKIPTMTGGKKNMPPAYMQNVCGVLQLSEKYPTKLELHSSWEPNTAKGDICTFYTVDINGKVEPYEKMQEMMS